MRRLLIAIWRPPVSVKLTLFVLVVLAYGATGFVYFERPGKPELSWLDGLWWAMVTMSTLGYGDYFPVTPAGRFLVGYPVILIGLGFLALAMSNLASFFIRADALNRKGLSMVNLKDHVLLIHYPSIDIVSRMVRELRAQSARAVPIVLVDEDLEELPSVLARDDVHLVRGNPALEATLSRAGLPTAASAVILAADPRERASDDGVVAVCLSLKSLRKDLHVVAECVDGASDEVLRRAGADSIVCVANLAPGILAHESSDPGVATVLHELTVWSNTTMNVFVVPLRLRQGAATVDVLRRHCEGRQATLLGVRAGAQIHLNPPSERPIVPGEAAVVMCRDRPALLEL